MDLGSELRQARALRGLSLYHLSDVTKISVPMLRAIEDNNLARLPGGIFTRGFIKAYAREVGLNPTEIVQRYAAELGESNGAAASSSEQSPAVEPANAQGDAEPSSAHRVDRSRPVQTITAVSLAAIVFMFSSQWHRASRPDRTARGEEVAHAIGDSLPQQATVARAETATTGSVASNGAPAKAPDTGVRLDLQARGSCWISVSADGREVVHRLMEAGDRQTIEGHEELVLRIGDPANLDYSINTSPGRPLGQSGEAVIIRVTPQNYRDFLSQ